MNETEIRTSNLIKTPKHGISIGEPFKDDSGHYRLRIKKPKSNIYEDLPLDQLLSMVVAGAETNTTNQ